MDCTDEHGSRPYGRFKEFHGTHCPVRGGKVFFKMSELALEFSVFIGAIRGFPALFRLIDTG